MTAVAIAAQRIFRFAGPSLWVRTGERFLELNRRGFVTIGLAVACVSGVALYVVALAVLFDTGFAMRDASREADRIEQDVLAIEIELQRNDTHFLSVHEETLRGLEVISDITYIPQDRRAALAPSGVPGK